MIYALLLLIAAPPDTFTGKVTDITDGDSIKVLHEKTEVTIRLEGTMTHPKQSRLPHPG
jgi:endonuclease YncB( thermonuclease family)